MKKEVKSILKSETVKFLNKQVGCVGSNNSKWLKHVKTLTACPGEAVSFTFSLPNHVEENLTAFESSDRICEFFSTISQEYTPLNVDLLPER